MEQYINIDFLKETYEQTKHILESLKLPTKWTYSYNDEGCHETLRNKLNCMYDIAICSTNDRVYVSKYGHPSLFSSTISNFDNVSFIEQINNLIPNLL